MILALHVYQEGNIPAHSEDTRAARYVTYGAPMHGRYGNIFVHDEPVDTDQKVWLEQQVYTRVAPGGVVRHLPSPSPVSRPKVSDR